MSALVKSDFWRLSLLIFALLMLPLCNCTAKNPNTAIKEAAEDTVSEEKISLVDNDAIFPVSEEEDRHCLSFSKGRDINHVEEFISFFKLKNHVTYKVKQTEEVRYVDIFSAGYDLNDDGKDEYFYYFESAWVCGMQMGCPINVYEYDNGKFRELFKYGIITNNYFDPRKEEDSNYLCIDKEKDSGWKRIHRKKLPSTFFYNGKEYVGRKP